MSGLRELLLAAAGALLLTCGIAHANTVTVAFSFLDDPAANLANRTHLGGSVTGLLFGLSDDTSNQAPTSVQFTSDVSGVGLTSAFINAFTDVEGSGISIFGGVVTAANLLLNFDDPGAYQLAFNTNWFPAPENRLIWNGADTPVVGIGNAQGFEGTTFSIVAPVPLPTGISLLGAALAGLAALALWRRSRLPKATPAAA